ncbi:sigma-E factor negative regulatory protein [Chromatium okenii]|uniref:sigma-E factor negative regulatory protein n=1 Tax=Chromatium okenii TaxID=61644 RepID=UPI0026EC6C12|nr:sigma-E factor negative regulatory protein [Chromatium okenii]MBV5308946.1 sigma-E factor negative regulatory protein [Chromatium okenii]
MNQAQHLTDKQRFLLSNLQDGALDGAELPQLLDAVAEDADLRCTWERYQLIGQLIRGESYAPLARQVSPQVHLELAIAPVLPLPLRIRAVAMHTQLRFAIAASVVGVAVFVAPAWLEHSASPDHVEIAQEFVPAEAASGGRWHLDQPHLANKLDRFLVTHQETAPIGETKGMLRYATFVRDDLDR